MGGGAGPKRQSQGRKMKENVILNKILQVSEFGFFP